MRWAKKLEEYVESQGMSLAEWLRKHDIPHSSYYRWKREGRMSMRRISQLIALTNGYLTCEDFFDTGEK